MLWLTTGILAAWGMWALIDVSTEAVFLSFRAFGLISPLVGLVCLVLSLVALQERRSRWHAVSAALLSVVIAVVPFFAIPYDPS
jgi:hypothetical protein